MAEVFCSIDSSGVDPDPARYSGRVYTTLEAWQTAQKDNDWSSDVCVAELNTDIVNSSMFTISGWNVGGNTNGPRITCRPGKEHNGDSTQGVSISRTNGRAVRISQDGVHISDIRMFVNIHNSDVLLVSNGRNVRVYNCIFGENRLNQNFALVNCAPSSGSPGPAYYYNNLFMTGAATAELLLLSQSSGTREAIVTNNTFSGQSAAVAIEASNGDIKFHNNLVIDFTTSLVEVNSPTITGSNNVSPDAGLPGDLGITPESSDLVSTTDGRLSTQGVTKYSGQGVNREAEDSFDFDIENDTRPAGAWTVGADEEAGAAPGATQNAILHGTEF